jgi:hypothetical protein
MLQVIREILSEGFSLFCDQWIISTVVDILIIPTGIYFLKVPSGVREYTKAGLKIVVAEAIIALILCISVSPIFLLREKNKDYIQLKTKYEALSAGTQPLKLTIDTKSLAEAMVIAETRYFGAQKLPNKSLKKRALQFSKNLLAFISERERMRPQFPFVHSDQEWKELINREEQFYEETVNIYRENYATEAIIVLDGIKNQKVPIPQNLDLTCRYAVNKFVIEECATGIGVLADKLNE